MDRGAWQATVLGVRKVLETTEQLTLFTFTKLNGLAKQKASMDQIQPVAYQYANHDLESSVTRLVPSICLYHCLYQFEKVISFMARMILKPLLKGFSIKEGQGRKPHTPFMHSHFAKWLLPALGG